MADNRYLICLAKIDTASGSVPDIRDRVGLTESAGARVVLSPAAIENGLAPELRDPGSDPGATTMGSIEDGPAPNGLGGLVASLKQAVAQTGAKRTQKYNQGPFEDRWPRADQMRLVASNNGLKAANVTVADHTKRKIDRINSSAMTTQRTSRDGRVPHKGQYRRWLPGAMQRVCLGGDAIQPRQDNIRASASWQVLADFWDAWRAPLYLRKTAALKCLTLQRIVLMSFPNMQHAIWVCMLDKHSLRFACQAVPAKSLLQKGVISCPDVLCNCKATTILGAQNRTSKSLGYHLAGKVLKSQQVDHCLRLYLLHVPCLMHKVGMVLNAFLKPLFIINPLCCSIAIMTSTGIVDSTESTLKICAIRKRSRVIPGIGLLRNQRLTA